MISLPGSASLSKLAFAERHIEVEEGWSIKEIPSHIARLARNRHKELRALLGSEENILTVFDSGASEIW